MKERKLTKNQRSRNPPTIHNPPRSHNPYPLPRKLPRKHIPHLGHKSDNPGPALAIRELVPARIYTLADQHVDAVLDGLARRGDASYLCSSSSLVVLGSLVWFGLVRFGLCGHACRNEAETRPERGPRKKGLG